MHTILKAKYKHYSLTLLGFTFLCVSGCGSDSSSDSDPENNLSGTDDVTETVSTGNWYKPAVDVTWQWQIQGNTIDTSYAVELYDIDPLSPDLTNAQSVIDKLHAEHRKVICYFSAGSYESWRDDADKFTSSDLGNTLNGYENERWLDIRTDNVRNIMQSRLQTFKNMGCDGVEPDNVNVFENDSGLPITAENQLTYNKFIANEAHKLDLSVGLKNDISQAAQLVDYFDFHLSEECHEFAECDILAVFVDNGKPVLNAEYHESYKQADGQATLCAQAKVENIRTVVFSKELDNGYRYSCD